MLRGALWQSWRPICLHSREAHTSAVVGEFLADLDKVRISEGQSQVMSVLGERGTKESEKSHGVHFTKPNSADQVILPNIFSAGEVILQSTIKF